MDTEGRWMQTFTDKKVWPLSLRFRNVDIYDIIQSLGHTYRYNGHPNKVQITVAEHSVIAWEAAKMLGYDSTVRKWTLLHDAPEAYIGDLIAGVKCNAYIRIGTDFLPWSTVETHIMNIISVAIKLPVLPDGWLKYIKKADMTALATEKAAAFKSLYDWGKDGYDPLPKPVEISWPIGLPCEVAMNMFTEALTKEDII